MKKSIIALTILGLISTTSFANTELTKKDTNENIVKIDIAKKETTKDILSKQSQNIQKMYKKNPSFFKTSPRLKSDLVLEQKLITNLKSKYIAKKAEYKKADYDLLMNKLFVDALKTGNRNLADVILYDSGANIDVNFKSDSPKNTPLMAVATSLAYDGGDIEYAMKLIDMGANIDETTTKNDIPLLSLASSVNNYKIVLYLTMKGANPMHLDGLDYYPLDYATKNDAYQTVVILTSLIDSYTKEILKKQ